MAQEEKSVALALPDEVQFRHDIQAINRFQNIVHQNLIPNQDYGVIPGTQKPTLLKPGAEKIAKLLGLADQYEIVDRQEDWTKPFFRYLIRCKLVHIVTESLISEGLGECNSMESKYRYRWVSDRDLSPGTDKSKQVSQERRSKTGGKWTVYRLDNEDIYSQVNTILKMAKKRALVDAALSAGRLSNIFTQDIEDISPETVTEQEPKQKAEPEARPLGVPDKQGTAQEAKVVESTEESQQSLATDAQKKDEALVTKEDLATLTEAMNKAKKGTTDVGKIMNVDLDWKIAQYKDLKKWQLAELLDILVVSGAELLKKEEK